MGSFPEHLQITLVYCAYFGLKTFLLSVCVMVIILCLIHSALCSPFSAHPPQRISNWSGHFNWWRSPTPDTDLQFSQRTAATQQTLLCVWMLLCFIGTAAVCVCPTLQWQCRLTRCPAAAAAVSAARGPWAPRRCPAACPGSGSTGPGRGSCWLWESLRWSWGAWSWQWASRLWLSPRHPESGTRVLSGQVSLWVQQLHSDGGVVMWGKCDVSFYLIKKEKDGLVGWN